MQNYKVFALFFAFQACFSRSCDHPPIQKKLRELSRSFLRCGRGSTHNASTNSKHLAKCLYEEADKAGYKGNRCVPATKYWVGNYGIVRDKKCPAVLTENLFQDNKEDVAILMSETGKHAMVDIHVIGAVMGLCAVSALFTMFVATDISKPIWIVWASLCCASAVSWLVVESTRRWQKGKRNNQTAKQ